MLLRGEKSELIISSTMPWRPKRDFTRQSAYEREEGWVHFSISYMSAITEGKEEKKEKLEPRAHRPESGDTVYAVSPLSL